MPFFTPFCVRLPGRVLAALVLALLVVATVASAASAATRPAPPRDVRVTGYGSTSVVLQWTRPAGVIAGFRLTVGSRHLTSTRPKARVTGLHCGSAYTVKVQTVGTTGLLSTVVPRIVQIPSCIDRTPPTAPGALRVAASSATQLRLAWKPSHDPSGIASYDVELDGRVVATTRATTATVGGLTCGWHGTAVVVATDRAGNRQASSTLAVQTNACPDRTPPTAPGRVHVASTTTTSYTLAWTAATDAVGVAGYRVAVGGQLVASTTGRSARVRGLPCGWRGSAVVSARDAAGNSRSAPATSVWTRACPASGDTSPPSAPGNLSQRSATQSAVTVGWDASTDDRGVTGYDLRKDGVAAGSVDGGTQTATFSGLSCGASVTIGVLARDAAGNTSPVSLVSARTADCPISSGADLYLSPTGSDSGSCTASAPCRTFDRAYRVASPGDSVQLAAGSYGRQAIGLDTSKTSTNDVTFAPASGAAVSTGTLDVDGRHVTLEGFTVNGDWGTSDTTDDVTFRNLAVNGAVFINSSSNISVVGGSVGGVVDSHPQFASWPLNTHISNILVDGVRFHDMSRTSSSVHTECLQIAGGVGITVRRSTFTGCAVLDLSFTEYNGSGPPTDVLVENNVFDDSTSGGYNSFHLNTNATNFINFEVRYNSATQAFAMIGLQRLTNVHFVGNVAPLSAAGCEDGITYSHNVWQGTRCSSSDVNAATGFVDAQALDLRLKPGAAAIDAGDPTDYPATDITGKARPAGGAPDAGAYESG